MTSRVVNDSAGGTWPATRLHPRSSSLMMAAVFAVCAVALTQPTFPLVGQRFRRATIYPWWVAVLVAIGLAASLATMLAGAWAERVHLRAIASAAVLVVGAQVSGTGFVAYKHWHPATGMGGGSGNLDVLEPLAVVIGIAGLAAVVTALAQLVSQRDLPHHTPALVRGSCVASGVAVIIGMPFAIMAADTNSADLTSWGAAGLIYAGPWGGSLIGAGWLSRPASLALLVTSMVSAGMAAKGPQMADLFTFTGTPLVLVVAGLVPLLPVAAWLITSGPWPARRTPARMGSYGRGLEP
jgi:hypothetical protein